MDAFEADSLATMPRSSIATEYLPNLPPQTCISKAAQGVGWVHWDNLGVGRGVVIEAGSWEGGSKGRGYMYTYS